MSLDLDVKLTLNEGRCYQCGRWWAREAGYEGSCPMCSRNRIRELEEKLCERDKTISALRGAVTRAKGKR